MFCIHCGKQLEGRPKFCHFCGKPQTSADHIAGMATAAPYQPVKKGRSTWMTCAIITLALTIVCSAVFGGVALMLGMHRTRQTAQIVPNNTGALLTFSPSPRQLPQLIGAEDKAIGLAPLAALPGVIDLVEVVRDELDPDLDIDPQDDLLPWIGWEMGVAILYDEAGSADISKPSPGLAAPQARWYSGPPIILTAATRSERRSDAFLADLRDQLEDDGVRFDIDSYRGIEITQIVEPYGLPLSYATFNRLVVIATDPKTLQNSIDTALDDRRVLGEREEYREMISDLPGNRLGTLWLDWPVIARYLGAEDLDELPVGSLAAIEELGVAISLEESGVLYDYLIRYDLRELSENSTSLMEIKSSKQELIKLAPADTVVYYSGQNAVLEMQSLLEPVAEAVDEVYQELLEEFDPYADPGEAETFSEYVERELGIDLEEDLLSEMEDEFALVLAVDSGNRLDLDVPAGVLILVQLDDKDRVEETLETFMREFEREQELNVFEYDLRGINVFGVEERGGVMLMLYGFVKDVLFVASSEAMVEALADARDSPLADSERFRAAVKPLPSDGRTYLYLDAETVVEWITESMSSYDRRTFEEDAADLVDRVQAVTMTSGSMNRKGVVRGALYVHTTD